MNLIREEIINRLKTCIAEVTFKKVDGSERVMRCTLKPDVLPVSEKVVEEATNVRRVPSPTIIPVYDIEIEGWRCFRLGSVINIKWDV